jgi:hypothetical protein
MATMIVEKEKVPVLVEQWLNRPGKGQEQVEVVFRAGEVTIRQRAADETSLSEWLDRVTKEWSPLLKKLAE